MSARWFPNLLQLNVDSCFNGMHMNFLNDHLEIKKIALAVLAIFLCSTASHAADIYRTNLNKNIYEINIDGSIQKGDADNFIRLVLAKNDAVYLWVGLNSNGGDVDESLKLASLVEQLRLRTKVKPQGICASACFFIWVVGEPHVAVSNPSSQYLGVVGLHRPYLKNPQNESKSFETQARLQKNISDFLSAKFVPNRLIDLMMSKPSNDIYWLTRQDIAELGKYAAPIEELYINKCQYNRKHSYMLADLEVEKRFEEYERLKKIVDVSEDCVAELYWQRGLEGLTRFVAKYEKSHGTSAANVSANTGDETALVERLHPNWISLVKTQRFKNWFDKQPVDVQKLSESSKAVDAIKMLDKFKAESKGKN